MAKFDKNKKKAVYQQFQSKTKIKAFSKINLDPKTWPSAWKVVHAKSYPRFETVKLPKKIPTINNSLDHALVSRESKRKFRNKPISISALGSLLFHSAGVVPSRGRDWDSSRRFYPSAGARYPLELYLSAHNVSSLKKGLYHYNVRRHGLDVLRLDNKLDKKMGIISGQEWVAESQVCLLISAVFGRMNTKYGDRGYRHTLFEAGHLGQNIYLVANLLSLKTCAIGGFIDDKINKLIDLDEESEAIIYMFALGN